MADITVADHAVDQRIKNLADASSKVVLRSHASPVEDIRAERGRSSFSSRELAEYLHGGPENLKRRYSWVTQLNTAWLTVQKKQELALSCQMLLRRAEIIGLLQSQPWGSKKRRHHLTRKEEYVDALRGVLGIWWAHRQPLLTALSNVRILTSAGATHEPLLILHAGT